MQQAFAALWSPWRFDYYCATLCIRVILRGVGSGPPTFLEWEDGPPLYKYTNFAWSASLFRPKLRHWRYAGAVWAVVMCPFVCLTVCPTDAEIVTRWSSSAITQRTVRRRCHLVPLTRHCRSSWSALKTTYDEWSCRHPPSRVRWISHSDLYTEGSDWRTGASTVSRGKTVQTTATNCVERNANTVAISSSSTDSAMTV